MNSNFKSISVSVETYDRIKATAESQGMAISQLVEAILADVHSDDGPQMPESLRTIACASCGGPILSAVPYRMHIPGAQDGAFADVCASCKAAAALG
jgi:hypothetical protein